MIQVISAEDSELVMKARELVLEYTTSLGVDLSFQNFEEEIATFPRQYSPPRGRMLLAHYEEKIAGCAGLRDLGDGYCEMKRMYVQPVYRGRGLGRALSERLISEAREIGYTHMRLDTVPSMEAAVSLYRSLGFKDIEPYRFNPFSDAMFMELKL